MKKIIFILLLNTIGHFSFGQNNNHIIFGVNLDLDWYSLTNYQQLAYNLVDSDTSNKDPLIITDFEFSRDKINRSFLDIGFDELLLGFPRGMETKLNELKPEIFLARKNYKDINEYLYKYNIDITKSIALINQEFGNPKSSKLNDKYSVYEWKTFYSYIILTCREDDLTTTLIYTKQ